MKRDILSDDQVLTGLAQYVSEQLVRSPTWADVCSAEQAVALARVMAESTGVPLAELTIAQVKEFKGKLRDGGRPNPRSSKMDKALQQLTVQRGYLAIQYFLDFRKDVLKVKKEGVR